MPSARPTPAPEDEPSRPRPRGFDDGRALVIFAAGLPLAVFLVLALANVPLGCPGRFTYLYSPLALIRAPRALGLIAIGGVVAAGLYLLCSAGASGRRRIGGLLILVGLLALPVWTYLAPPAHWNQLFFITFSPSHDGAFVMEAVPISSVRNYLAEFPRRARLSPEAMRGTRVISNPPGITMLAKGIDEWLRAGAHASELPHAPPQDRSAAARLSAWVIQPLEALPTNTLNRHTTAVGFLFAWCLLALWVAAALPLYGAARLFAPPAWAAACCVCCVAAPAAVLLSPGKDAAQLLTAAVPLYLWLLAWRRGRTWAAALAGVALVLAVTVSLVHVWLAACVALATAAAVWPQGPSAIRPLLTRVILPAAIGAGLTVAVLKFGFALDLLATARAVAASQAEVTRGPHAMPLAWQALGLPLFLLFAGPAVWSLLLCGLRRRGRAGVAAPPESPRTDAARRAERRFGGVLLLGTVLVLGATIGFTNMETPRLWIPFVPLVLLGALPLLTQHAAHKPRLVHLLPLLVLLQFAGTAVQWTFMDMRETENRVISGTYYGE